MADFPPPVTLTYAVLHGVKFMVPHCQPKTETVTGGGKSAILPNLCCLLPITVGSALGVVHKLRLQNLALFLPPTPFRLHFLWYERLQKVNFFTTYPLLL